MNCTLRHSENARRLAEGGTRTAWRLALSIFLFAYIGAAARAMEPPRGGEIEAYRKDGTLAQRAAFAKNIANNRIDPALLARKQVELRRAELEAQGMSRAEIDRLAPVPGHRLHGMPSKGNVKLLALLIAFKDYGPTSTAEYIHSNLFGDGDGARYPYESLRNYYLRASYNQLDVQGTTLGWYTTPYNRDQVPMTGAGRQNLIKEALNFYNAAGHDFTQYDGDNDGYIDYMIVIWAGPDNGWANFWWGYFTNFTDSSYVLDGKRLYTYSWQFQNYTFGFPFDPLVPTHETGHALGLPDYYDYDDSVGPGGGVGGLDMMDHNWGDHNCFSKWLLGWITPIVVNKLYSDLSLRASCDAGDAVMIMPGASLNGIFSEYFMVQNRYRSGNDSKYPADGMLIWHVDARLDASGQDFEYDNSYASHKLLRLMEADGLEEIERFRLYYGVNAGDYYVPGKTFGLTTTPNSRRYDNTQSRVRVNNFTAPGAAMSARFALVELTQPVLSAGSVTPSSGKPWDTFTFRVQYYDADGDAPMSDSASVYISGDGPYNMTLVSGTAANGTYAYSTTLPVGEHTFYFSFANAYNGVATTPVFSGPSVLSGKITLTVQSSPFTGISITGSVPGTTPYSAQVDSETQITLTAPSEWSQGGTDYDFLKWVVKGVSQPEGQVSVTFTPGTSCTATAVYLETVPPIVSNVGAVPSLLREGKDRSVTVVATADDSATGSSPIASAECFADIDPGQGKGRPMAADDGVLDSPTESLSATLDVTSWPRGPHSIFVRARDASGNWSAPAGTAVLMADGTPPGIITDLYALPFGSMRQFDFTVSGFSSEASWASAVSLADISDSTYWSTTGSVVPQTEFVILDLAGSQLVSGVGLVCAPDKTLFPTEFTIEVSAAGQQWVAVGVVKGLMTSHQRYLWQFDAVRARFVKISGPGVRSRSDGRYYWQMAGVEIYCGGGYLTLLTWTSPGADGYGGSAAAMYDTRYGLSLITEGSFPACTLIEGLGAPRSPGARERAIVGIPLSDIGSDAYMWLTIKTADDVPNWSAISNVVKVKPRATGFVSLLPEPSYSADAKAPPSFEFLVEPTIDGAALVFSTSPVFPAKSSVRPDGQVDKSMRIALKAGTLAWTPAASQWKALKALVRSEGALFWRLEGVSPENGKVFGPTRLVFFDSSGLANLRVSPSHSAGLDEALWPDAAAAPTFSWSDSTGAMKYYYVDVSVDQSIRIADRKKTVVLGGRGITEQSYSATAADWKKVRALAASGGGTLYWRVRGKDADKVLVYMSQAKKLVIDGGQWLVSSLDLGALVPQVFWTHGGQGIVAYSLQFSVDGAFPSSTRQTVKMPSKPVTGSSYTLTFADVAKLKKVAAANGVTALYYRVLGYDAQRAFVAYSDAMTADLP